MRKLASSLSIGVLVGSALAGAGAPASAAIATGCVSQAEFAQVTKGMTSERVAQIFGTGGKLALRIVLGGHVYTQRQYPPCPKASYVAVSYTDDHETSKTARWGALGDLVS
jgi:hypothetical protein